MLIDRKTANYIKRAIHAIDLGKVNIPLTDTCPECGEKIDDFFKASAGDGHVIYQTTSDTFAILVGCEGYWTIYPALLGLDPKGWTNPNGVEPFNDKGYPACPAATWENPHYLCFMERRDLDNCPECGTAIPPELQLNKDMTGPRVDMTPCTPTPGTINDDYDIGDEDYCTIHEIHGCIVDHS